MATTDGGIPSSVGKRNLPASGVSTSRSRRLHARSHHAGDTTDFRTMPRSSASMAMTKKVRDVALSQRVNFLEVLALLLDTRGVQTARDEHPNAIHLVGASVFRRCAE